MGYKSITVKSGSSQEHSRTYSTAADSMSHTVLQAQDRVLAAHDIKLVEHSGQDRLQEHGRCLVVEIRHIRRGRREAICGETPLIYSQLYLHLY